MVLITFTDLGNLQRYRETHRLPFPVVTDPDRLAYRAYGLGRGSIARVYGRRTVRRYLELFRSGSASGPGRLSKLAGLARPIEDPLQLGGDFVIDPEGRLVYGFWGAGPDDRPTVDMLVRAVTGPLR